MNFKIDNRISEKYFSGFPRDSNITEITVHATAGGKDAESVIDWMVAGGDMGGGKTRAADYRRGIGLFHFIISPNGEVTRITDTDKWVYHSTSSLHDKLTIGIELVKPDSHNATAPTDEQYLSLIDMIILLRKLYPSIDTIASHDFNAAKYSGKPPKPCPGNFDWNKLRDNFGEVTFNV